jgi:hypothetical protein
VGVGEVASAHEGILGGLHRFDRVIVQPAAGQAEDFVLWGPLVALHQPVGLRRAGLCSPVLVLLDASVAMGQLARAEVLREFREMELP